MQLSPGFLLQLCAKSAARYAWVCSRISVFTDQPFVVI
jgi:hypothetical protein